jgi:hypothetical protein
MGGHAEIGFGHAYHLDAELGVRAPRPDLPSGSRSA